MMNADGSSQVRLTNDPSADLEPAWSPDGTQIALSTNREGNSEIYVLDVACAQSDPSDINCFNNLTNNLASDTTPDWGVGDDVVAPPSCIPAPQGLISWWSGEGTAEDIQGGNNGVLKNGATFATGKVGQAFSFDGVDDYVDLGTGPIADGLNAMTVEAWVKADSYTGNLAFVYNYTGSIADGWVLQSVNGKLRWSVQVSLAQTFVDSINPIPTGEYVHVAGRYDGSTLKVYINGVLENSAPFALGPIIDAPNETNIGRWPGGAQYFNGQIDEVGIFDRALTISEIQDIFNAGSAGKCTPPIVQEPDLSVTIEATPDPVGQGEDITYEVVVSNALGAGDSVEAELLLDFPFGVLVESITPFSLSCQFMIVANDWKCAIPNLVAGDSIVVRVIAGVSLSSGQILVIANVTPINPPSDLNPDNNGASLSTAASDDFDGDGIKNNVDSILIKDQDLQPDGSPIQPDKFLDQSKIFTNHFSDENSEGTTAGTIFDSLALSFESPFIGAASSNFSENRTATVDSIVLHFCADDFRGCINTFETSGEEVSAHYVVSKHGDVVQMVDEKDTAFHALGGYNKRSIGIEIEGCYSPLVCNPTNTANNDPVDFYTHATYESLANLIAEIRLRNPGIPLEHSGAIARPLALNETAPGLDANGCLDASGLVGHDEIQPAYQVDSDGNIIRDKKRNLLVTTDQFAKLCHFFSVKRDARSTKFDPGSGPENQVFNWTRLVQLSNERFIELFAGGSRIAVKDSPDKTKGVIIEAVGSGTPSVVPSCKSSDVMTDLSFTSGVLRLANGDRGVLTCDSLRWETTAGEVEILLGENMMLTVPTGAEVVMAESIQGKVEIENSSSSQADVTLEFGNSTIVLGPGESLKFVEIDIEPGSDPNRIKIGKNKEVNVAILSTNMFDSTAEVDEDSLRFGRIGDEDSLIRNTGKKKKATCQRKDVNKDRLKDLECKFDTQIAGFHLGDTEGVLIGRTKHDVLLVGRDGVEIVTKNNE